MPQKSKLNETHLKKIISTTVVGGSANYDVVDGGMCSRGDIPTRENLTFGVRVPICQCADYQNPYTISKGFIMQKVGPKDPLVPGLHTKKSWRLKDVPSQFCDLLRQFA